MESFVLQHTSSQDFVITGFYILNGEKIYWIANFDGHGTNTVIDCIRNIDFDKIMHLEHPLDYIKAEITKVEAGIKGIKGINGIESSGSTVCIVKIFPNRAEATWVGDSEIIISDGEKIIFKNEKHDMNHIDDIKNIRHREKGNWKLGKRLIVI